MKYLTKVLRRASAAFLAVAMLAGVIVPVTLPVASAVSFAEYEQTHYFRNGDSPMDAAPEAVTLSASTASTLGETNAVISLDGTWDMTDTGKIADLAAGRGWEKATPATVPGSIYTALMEAGVIKDPYMGTNMRSANQYSERSWYFRRTFTYNGTGERVRLDFDGLCNVADIYLNGRKIASHEGMFGGPYVDITDTVKPGENTLVVHLYPAKDYTQTVVFNCSYGWHYAKLYPLGIWQSVTVRDLPSVTLDSPFITTTDYKTGTVDLAIELDRGDAAAIAGELTVTISPKNFDGKSYTFTKNISKGAVDSATLRYRTNIPECKLWWPNGYGEQNLYNLEVSFKATDGTTSYTKSSFGIRQLDYKALPSGENPNSYNRQFVINGVDVYMKGASWCTIDAMMRFEREDYDRILSRARDAGINYVRAWGGGLVETDEFYDLCDEYGICVYQEWPCCWDSQKTQPADVLYETVVLGAKRLRNRPSLVVWGGGNEGVAALDDKVMNTIGKLTYETDGTRDFWRQDGGTGGTNITHDHIHWSGASPEHYLKTYANFLNLNLTEYGLSCMMNYESIQKYATAEEMAKWPLNQRGTIAYHTATFNGMLGWNPSPHGYDLDTFTHYASMFTEVDSLEDLITGSQLAQAQSLYLPAINARINAPYSSNNVVYKMNDNYPGASWAIVDWYGSPKIAYYLVQDAYRPLMAAAKLDRYNTVDATGHSTALSLPIHILDDVKALTGKDWCVTVTAYDEELAIVKTQDFTGKSISTTSQKVGDFSLTAAETAHTPLILTVDLTVGGQFLNRTYAYLNFETDPGCLFYLPRTSLTYAVDGNTVTVTNTGDKPAVGVQLLAPATSDTFVTEDNHFFLAAGESVTLTVSDGGAIEGVDCLNLANTADKVAPSVPADLAVTEVTHDEVTLTWTASSDEGGLYGYTLTLTDAAGGTRAVFIRDNKTAVTLSGLAEVSTYTASLTAEDRGGNRSEASNTVSFKTTADPTLPAVMSSTVTADGKVTLTFSTPMDKGRAEDAEHYLLTGDGKVTAANLSEDGLTVTLTLSGVDTSKRFALGVVNLTDRKHAQNNIGYTAVTVDPGLVLSMDFEPDAAGQVFTGGESARPVTGVNKDLSITDGGHSGASLTASTSALVHNLDFCFAEGQSVSLWVRGKAGADFNVLFAKGPKAAGHFEIYARSGKLNFYAPDIGDLDMKFDLNSLGEGWHNLVFVRKDGKLITYADGREVSAISCKGRIAETVGDFSVGALNDGSLGFAGAVDTLRLYDRLLTDEEIADAAGYRGDTAVVEGNIIGHIETTDFDLTEGSSVNLWFNADSFPTDYAVFFAKGTKSSAKHFELYTENGVLKLYAPALNGGNPLVFGTDMRAYVGSWHMLTLVGRDGKLLLFIDGVPVASVATDFGIPSGSDRSVYGRLVEGGMDFKGQIAEGELLTEALSDDVIKARYEEKLVKPDAEEGLFFAASYLSLTLGERVPLGLSAVGDHTYSVICRGDAVVLDGDTVTAVAIGDCVLYARSDDGAYITAMVIRVAEELPEESETETETETDTETETETEASPDTPAESENESHTPTTGAPATETEGESEAAPETPTAPQKDKGGCGSVLGGSVLLLLAGCAACGACLRRRKAWD